MASALLEVYDNLAKATTPKDDIYAAGHEISVLLDQVLDDKFAAVINELSQKRKWAADTVSERESEILSNWTSGCFFGIEYREKFEKLWDELVCVSADKSTNFRVALWLNSQFDQPVVSIEEEDRNELRRRMGIPQKAKIEAGQEDDDNRRFGRNVLYTLASLIVLFPPWVAHWEPEYSNRKAIDVDTGYGFIFTPPEPKGRPGYSNWHCSMQVSEGRYFISLFIAVGLLAAGVIIQPKPKS